MALLMKKTDQSTTLNINDIIVIAIIVCLIFFFHLCWHDMHTDLTRHHLNDLKLDIRYLPYYTLRTTMRLLLGLGCSLIFTIIFGTLAASFAPMRHIILPIVNFMESIPLVGFLSFTTLYFLHLYPHNEMGLECAAIFAVFTGQAWNMMLALYQSLRIVPSELNEVTRLFAYNPWQRFWRVGFPYSFPSLLWNTMVSQSAAWFALIASEAIPVGNKTVNLPGIGAYIAQGLSQGDIHAVAFAVIALIINVIILDQLLFRPLVRYASKFKYEDAPSPKVHSSWFYTCLAQSATGQCLGTLCRLLTNLWLYTLPTLWYTLRINKIIYAFSIMNWLWSSVWYMVIAIFCLYFGYHLWLLFPKTDFAYLPTWMGLTALRVIIAMLLSILIFTPIGIWIGLNPRLVKFFQPIIQILAAIPANVFYPLIAICLVAFHQQLGWWTIPMIMLGTQWYILFNVIAGTSMLPNQMLEVSKVFNVKGIMWWTKFIIPAIFPYLVTGIISAAGGAWNTAIAAEVLDWGKTQIAANGLGAFISITTRHGDIPQAALGCAAMCVMVALCIIFIWRPLYRYAETRFKID